MRRSALVRSFQFASALGLALLHSSPALAEAPGMDDLVVTKQVQVGTDQATQETLFDSRWADAASPLDSQAFDARLEEAEAQVERMLEVWKRVYVAGETMLGPNDMDGASHYTSGPINDENCWFDEYDQGGKLRRERRCQTIHTWQIEKYRAAKQAGEELATLTAETSANIAYLLTYFQDQVARNFRMYQELIPRHSRVARVVSIYQAVIRNAAARSLSFDNFYSREQHSWVLPGPDYLTKDTPGYPDLPQVVIQWEGRDLLVYQGLDVEAAGREAVPAWASQPWIFTQQVSQVLTSIRYRAAEKGEIRSHLQGFEKRLSRVQDLREKLDSKKTRLDRYSADDHVTQEYLVMADTQAYDQAKSMAADLVEEYIQARAERDAARALLQGSRELEADLNVAAELASSNTRLDNELKWIKRTGLRLNTYPLDGRSDEDYSYPLVSDAYILGVEFSGKAPQVLFTPYEFEQTMARYRAQKALPGGGVPPQP